MILIGASVWYANTVSERNNEGVTVVAQTKGNPEGVISLVEYSDFQCPACAAFQPHVDSVLESYGQYINFEYRHFPLPFHALAEPAARAAEAAGQQGKFFEYADRLFANQATWSRSPNPSGLFVSYAEEIGLDIELFERHMNASLLRDKIRADAQAGRDKGVTGTPTFFLNGERMQYTSFEEFRLQIENLINPEVEFNIQPTN